MRFWTALVEDISFWLVDKLNLTQGVFLLLDLVRVGETRAYVPAEGIMRKRMEDDQN